MKPEDTTTAGMPPVEPPVRLDHERAAFEAWLNPGHHAGNVSAWVEPGRYEKDTHNLAWLAWKASAAAERERIALHFDERNAGPDGKPLGLGFYDPHEPAEITRALGPNAKQSRATRPEQEQP